MRYKEYNANKVLDQSISLFWQHGFNGCSINDLVTETGVNRFSLYQEFGNKEGILYHSLGLYEERYCENKFDVLHEPGELKEVLLKFYLSFLNESDEVMGCYFIHIGTELADDDERIRERVANFLSRIENELKQLLIRNNYSEESASFKARHLLALYSTAMSFCLIHSELEREAYIKNSIDIILSE